MIFSDFTFNGITFKKFVRTSGYMAEVIPSDVEQIRTTRDPLPGQSGVQRYIDYYGARHLTIRGFVKGSNQTDLYTKINALEAAFDIKALEALGSFGFLPLQWIDPGQNQARYYVKPMTNTLNVEEARTGLSRRFSVELEAKDPVKYQAAAATFTVTSQTSVGSSAFPKAFPFAFAGSSYYGDVTILNAGALPVYPSTIVLNGPSSGTWTGPKISNRTSGSFIQFNSTVTLAVSEYITINPAAGTAVKTSATGTNTDVTPYISTASSFFLVAAGSSTIRIEGSTMPAGSQAIITILSSF